MPHAKTPSLIAVSTAQRGAMVRLVAAALAVGWGALASEARASLVLPVSVAAASDWADAAWMNDEDSRATSTAPTAVVLDLPRPQTDWDALVESLGRLKPGVPVEHESGTSNSGGSGGSTSLGLPTHAIQLDLLTTSGRLMLAAIGDVPPGVGLDLLKPPRRSA